MPCRIAVVHDEGWRARRFSKQMPSLIVNASSRVLQAAPVIRRPGRGRASQGDQWRTKYLQSLKVVGAAPSAALSVAASATADDVALNQIQALAPSPLTAAAAVLPFAGNVARGRSASDGVTGGLTAAIRGLHIVGGDAQQASLSTAGLAGNSLTATVTGETANPSSSSSVPIPIAARGGKASHHGGGRARAGTGGAMGRDVGEGMARALGRRSSADQSDAGSALSDDPFFGFGLQAADATTQRIAKAAAQPQAQPLGAGTTVTTDGSIGGGLQQQQHSRAYSVNDDSTDDGGGYDEGLDATGSDITGSSAPDGTGIGWSAVIPGRGRRLRQPMAAASITGRGHHTYSSSTSAAAGGGGGLDLLGGPGGGSASPLVGSIQEVEAPIFALAAQAARQQRGKHRHRLPDHAGGYADGGAGDGGVGSSLLSYSLPGTGLTFGTPAQTGYSHVQASSALLPSSLPSSSSIATAAAASAPISLHPSASPSKPSRQQLQSSMSAVAEDEEDEADRD